MGVAPSNDSTPSPPVLPRPPTQRPKPPPPSQPISGEGEATSAGKVCDWWNGDGNVITIQDRRQDWDEKSKFFKNSNCETLVVVEFCAQWSGPSRFIGQFIDKLAKANKDVLFLRLNYDSMEDVASEERVDVVPTFLLYKGGVVKEKIVGAKRFELSVRIDQLKQGDI